MALNQLHESHIGLVYAAIDLCAPNLDPAEVTRTLEVQPDATARKGDNELTRGDRQLPMLHKTGWWQLSSEGKVQSKDLNDHLRYLLEHLLPRRADVVHLTAGGEIFINVVWQSSYLHAGTGPVIDADVLVGISALGAAMGFDIYQIDEPA